MLGFMKKRIIGLNYMTRWHIIPRNRFFNIYLHRIEGDDGRDMHDHPWWSMSFLLRGQLVEEYIDRSFADPGRGYLVRLIPRLLPVVRSATFAHRLEVWDGPVWTLFITGPVRRKWGFYTRTGFHDADFYLERQRARGEYTHG